MYKNKIITRLIIEDRHRHEKISSILISANFGHCCRTGDLFKIKTLLNIKNIFKHKHNQYYIYMLLYRYKNFDILKYLILNNYITPLSTYKN